MLRMQVAAVLAIALGWYAAPSLAAPSAWTLQLTWSPEFCEANLSSKEPQCTEERYFVVSGLQPLFDLDPPSCDDDDALQKDEAERWLAVVPNRAQVKKIWKRQGACSGLDTAGYFTQLERASRRVVIPEAFTAVTEKAQHRSRAEVKSAFIQSNPGLTAEAISMSCHGRWVETIEFCLDAAFEFRSCSQPERCRSEDLRFRELRDSRLGREPIYR